MYLKTKQKKGIALPAADVCMNANCQGGCFTTCSGSCATYCGYTCYAVCSDNCDSWCKFASKYTPV